MSREPLGHSISLILQQPHARIIALVLCLHMHICSTRASKWSQMRLFVELTKVVGVRWCLRMHEHDIASLTLPVGNKGIPLSVEEAVVLLFQRCVFAGTEIRWISISSLQHYFMTIYYLRVQMQWNAWVRRDGGHVYISETPSIRKIPADFFVLLLCLFVHVSVGLTFVLTLPIKYEWPQLVLLCLCVDEQSAWVIFCFVAFYFSQPLIHWWHYYYILWPSRTCTARDIAVLIPHYLRRQQLAEPRGKEMKTCIGEYQTVSK